MDGRIIEWIKSKYGCCIYADYYGSYINLWLDWWRGYHEPFHRYRQNNGKKNIVRDRYTLKMAKKVCEDWAAILLNEKTLINISDEKTSEFIQGKKGTGGILGENRFWTAANRLIEKAFAAGTGAITIRLENADMYESGRVKISEKTAVRLSYVSAEHIIPISVEGGVITEAAFRSEHILKGKKFLRLEVHSKNEAGNYVIHNHWFDTDGFRECELPEGLAAEFDTKSKAPWFAVIEPNIENCTENSGGMGTSVFSGAIDVLKGVDLAYNNFVQDIFLGSKKVFLKKDLIQDMFSESGDVMKVTPDDVGQQLFTFIDFPEKGEGESKDFIYEFNPALRVQDNISAVQAQLDYLSFKCGLGNKHYQFNSGGVVTATQYTGERQDLIQNAHKHYIAVEEFMLKIVNSLINIGREFYDLNVPGDIETEIVFDKSVVIDEAAERERDRADVRDKLMSPWEFRMKWYGETEEQARKMISEIAGTDEELYGEGDFE